MPSCGLLIGSIGTIPYLIYKLCFFFSFFKFSENVQQKNSIMFRIIITSNRMFDLIIVFDVLVFSIFGNGTNYKVS